MRVLAVLFLTSIALRAEAPVLGKAGDIEIGTGEIRELLAGLEADRQSPAARDTSAVAQYVRALLVQRLVLRQALEKEWDQEPAVVAKLVRARETALTDSYLEARSAPEPGYPNDEEVAAAYEANKSKLVLPRTFHLAQIYIAASKETEAAAKTKLDSVLKQLKAKSADFGAIARSSSEEPASAANDGKIGWLTEAQIQPEIREKLPKLALNTISDPIRLDDGWHILKVSDIKEASTPTLDQVRDQIVTQLRLERSRLKRQEYVAGLLKEHPVAINEIELNNVLRSPAK